MIADSSLLDNEIIDGLKELQGDDSEMMTDLLAMFKKAGAEDIQKIRLAVEAKDHLATQNAAHSLKSSAANLGASKLADLCHQIEMRGRQQDDGWASTINVLRELETVYYDSYSALKVALVS